jgi:alpha-glucosidase
MRLAQVIRLALLSSCAVLSVLPAVAEEMTLGNVEGAYQRSGDTISIRTQNAWVKLDFCTPTLVRVRTSFSGHWAEDEQVMVVKYTWASVGLTDKDAGEQLLFETDTLSVRVDKHPFRLAFYRKADGALIAADAAGGGGGVTQQGTTLTNRRALAASEQFYGLGERMDRFNWRGHSVTLNVGRGEHKDNNLGAYKIDAANYCPVPLLLSTTGYGVFFHTDRQSTWDLGERTKESYEFSADGGEMDYYFIYGPALKQVLGSYTELTGRTPLLPKPAYGLNFGTYSGGTWGFEEHATQEYVVGLGQRLRQEKIPADVIHLDSTWRRFGKIGGRNATSFEWREPNFHDPAAMFKALHDMHFSLVGIHVRPRIDNGEKTVLLDEARAAGAIANTPSNNIVNFFDPKAVDWWWQHAVLPKNLQGADFLKTDEGSIYPGDGPHNLFPVLYAKAAYEGFAAQNSRRGFNLTREGYAGVQRYPYIWAGDWPSRWVFYKPVVRAGLNIALSGIGAWGHNAGGFEERATEELYMRWTAFGFFNPVTHVLGMEHPSYKEPWNYGERALATFRRYAQLRYRLLPYIYSAAHQTYVTGVPMMRPLVLEYPEDAKVYDVDDQYLFGDSFMVAPVTTEGASSRSIYLPSGTWIDYWNGQAHDGGRTIDYPAPLETLPLFVKAGAILPMQPEMAYVDEKPVDPLTLEIFPAGESSTELYEDDGKSLGYQQGAFALTRISSSAGAKTIDVRVEAPAGTFVVAPRSFEFKLHVDAPRRVLVNDRPAPRLETTASASAGGWSYDTGAGVLWVRTEPGKKTSSVRLQIER